MKKVGETVQALLEVHAFHALCKRILTKKAEVSDLAQLQADVRGVLNVLGLEETDL